MLKTYHYFALRKTKPSTNTRQPLSNVNHRQGLGLGRVDLAGHDRGTGFVASISKLRPSRHCQNNEKSYGFRGRDIHGTRGEKKDGSINEQVSRDLNLSFIWSFTVVYMRDFENLKSGDNAL